MLGLHWSRPVIFGAGAIPALIAALAIVGLMWLDHTKQIAPSGARQPVSPRSDTRFDRSIAATLMACARLPSHARLLDACARSVYGAVLGPRVEPHPIGANWHTRTTPSRLEDLALHGTEGSLGLKQFPNSARGTKLERRSACCVALLLPQCPLVPAVARARARATMTDAHEHLERTGAADLLEKDARRGDARAINVVLSLPGCRELRSRPDPGSPHATSRHAGDLLRLRTRIPPKRTSR
jgi:hypothetical protein